MIIKKSLFSSHINKLTIIVGLRECLDNNKIRAIVFDSSMLVGDVARNFDSLINLTLCVQFPWIIKLVR